MTLFWTNEKLLCLIESFFSWTRIIEADNINEVKFRETNIDKQLENGSDMHSIHSKGLHSQISV